MSQTLSGGTQRQPNLDAPSSSSASGKLQQLYRPIADQLQNVEAILRSHLTSDTPFVDQLLEHSWLLGGKRMRPVLLLLSGMTINTPSSSHTPSQQISAMEHMAAALEMIHTATLVHDDVIDEAEVRRHEPTANSKWGNKVSVLLGDYLFTHAFFVGSKSGSVDALAKLAEASNKVCAGEMKQNYNIGRFEITESDYYEIISEKTAELCAVGCGIGALIAGADDQTVANYEQYGRNLGIAFQIIDDVLDLVGEPEAVGKTLGTDLANQKPTLPVIHSLQTLPQDQRGTLLQLLTNDNQIEGNQKDGSDLRAVLKLLNQTGSIEYARNAARDRIEQAAQFAASLDHSPAADALVQITQFVLKRSH